MAPKKAKSSSWIAVTCDNSFAIAQRSLAVKNPNLWNFFGGKNDPGETPIQAAIRELHEEAGIEVDAEQLKYLGRLITGEDTLHLFTCDFLLQPSITLNEESSTFQWIEKKKLLSMDRSLIHKHTALFLEYI